VTDHDAVGEAVARTVEHHGRIDALVNNAGWSKIEPVAERTLETWQRCLDVDLTGTFSCMRQVLPHMIERHAGAIVSISSIAAWETSTEHGAAYSAAKAGIMALTRVAAAENGPHGVRVNAIAPGWIETPLTQPLVDDPTITQMLIDRTPMKRWGNPDDVTGPALFLCSPLAGFITGAILPVDRGQSARIG